MTFDEYIKKFDIKLNDEQLEAVMRIDGAMLILAVPGSGKTTTIIARIGYMIKVIGIDPKSILTITYTRAATSSMRERYERFFGNSSDVEFRTIHGICAKILSYFEYVTGRKVFKLIEKEGEVMGIMRSLYSAITDEIPTEAELKELATLVTYHRNMLSKKEEIEQVQLENINFATFFNEYKQYKLQNKLMDHDDQLEYAYSVLKSKPDILTYFQRKYKYINVDEAQDTSKIQHMIIHLLAKQNIFMVGDEDQSIYGFRAAYPEALLKFRELYEGGEVLFMKNNYRSTEKIVDFANGFIKNNTERYEKEMQAVKSIGIAPKLITLHDFSNITSYLVSLAKNTETETAILYRNSENALPIISAFEENGIEYNVLGGDNSFIMSRTVQNLLDLLKFVEDPCDERLFMRLYYQFNIGMSRENAEKTVDIYRRYRRKTLFEYAAENGLTQYRFLSKLKQLPEMINTCAGLNTFDALKYCTNELCVKSAYFACDASDNHKLNVLLTIAASHNDKAEFVKYVNSLCDKAREHENKENRLITLSTIHSCKGLEYDRVAIIDTKQGTLPALYENKLKSKAEQSTYEEERRLFYVAATRAKKELLVFTAERENNVPIERSAFIDESFFPDKKRIIKHQIPQRQSIKTVNTVKDIKPARAMLSDKEKEAIKEKLVKGAVFEHAIFGKCLIVAEKSGVIRVKVFEDRSVKALHVDTVIAMGLVKSVQDME